MGRRSFIGALIGGVAAAAAVRTWPFRVYSFATPPNLAMADIDRALMKIFINDEERHLLLRDTTYNFYDLQEIAKTTYPLRIPQTASILEQLYALRTPRTGPIVYHGDLGNVVIA